MFDFLEAINTHSSATGHFKFNVKAKEFDSLYLRYRLNLKYIGKDTTFLGEDVFYKTSYSPALSR